MKYTLSNRQRKELDRGAELRIALPVNPDFKHDSMTVWLYSQLPELGTFREVQEESIWVNLNKKNEQEQSYLHTLLGEITDNDNIHSNQHLVSVRCVVVTLCDVPNPKTRYPTRWPGGPSEVQ